MPAEEVLELRVPRLDAVSMQTRQPTSRGPADSVPLSLPSHTCNLDGVEAAQVADEDSFQVRRRICRCCAACQGEGVAAGEGVGVVRAQKALAGGEGDLVQLQGVGAPAGS